MPDIFDRIDTVTFIDNENHVSINELLSTRTFISNSLSSTLDLLSGPPGAKGDPGSGGSAYFEFTQSIPSNNWQIIHNFGRKVNVSLFDDSGNEFLTDKIQLSPYNIVVVQFAIPKTGSAIVS
jgi:hypothetical protein